MLGTSGWEGGPFRFRDPEKFGRLLARAAIFEADGELNQAEHYYSLARQSLGPRAIEPRKSLSLERDLPAIGNYLLGY